MLDQPGRPSTAPGIGISPRGADDLRRECGSHLPAKAYQIFEQAVRFHRSREYGRALREYKKLRCLPLRGGKKIDLYDVSSIFRHNWDLLCETIKRSS
jgi:hypothetical protein